MQTPIEFRCETVRERHNLKYKHTDRMTMLTFDEQRDTGQDTYRRAVRTRRQQFPVYSSTQVIAESVTLILKCVTDRKVRTASGFL